MAENYNVASRLQGIFKKAMTLGDTRAQTVIGWSHIFQLPELSEHDRFHEVARLLRLLNAQVDLLEKRLLKQGMTASAYEKQLTAFRSAILPSILTSTWNNVRGRITAVAMSGLEIYAQMLGHEEDPIDSDELNDVLDRIQEFKQEILESDLPSHFSAFILKQLAIIERAIRDYQIVGSDVFGQAVFEIAVEQMKYRATSWEESDHKTRGKMKKIWDKFRGIVDSTAAWGERTSKAGKLIDVGVKLLDTADNIGKLLPPST